MVNVRNIGDSFILEKDNIQYAFPKGRVALTSNKKSTSVNFKLMGSRKTIISIPSDELGYGDAEEAIRFLQGMI